MDPVQTPAVAEISFGKEIAKSFVYSAAATTGVLVGFVAVGLAVSKIQERRKKNEAQKTVQNES